MPIKATRMIRSFLKMPIRVSWYVRSHKIILSLARCILVGKRKAGNREDIYLD